MISIGVRFRCVLADAGYGLSAPFRQGLTARKLAWAVGIPRHLKVYRVGVQLIWPVTKVRGRPRKRHGAPDSLSTAAEDMLASAQWRTVSWRSGTKGRLKARFAAVRVRTADGPPQRIWDKGQQRLPGDEAWLIGEHRASGEKKCYLAELGRRNGPPQLSCDDQGTMDLRAGPSTVERRRNSGSTTSREARHGLHRHALMAMIAYAFLLEHRRLKKVRRGKRIKWPAPSTDVAGGSPRHRRPHHAIKSSAMSVLPILDQRGKAA